MIKHPKHAHAASNLRQQATGDPRKIQPKLSSCIALALVSVSAISVFDVEAAPRKKHAKKSYANSGAVRNLQAEVERLTQALEESKKRELELLQNSSAATAATDGTGAPAGQDATAGAVESVAPEQEVAKEEKATDLGEVVVRAKPKLAALHNVKQSATVVSGQELSRELAVDLGAITRRTPNVQFNQNNTRGASISIRGLGKRSFTETQDPSVGVSVDNVAYGLTQLANFSFYDIENVEATRGPRGTEGGLAASAGKIKITTKAPSFTPTADLSASYGQREALLIQGALGGPVINDLLAWRGSFIVDKAQGFYTNKFDSNYSLYNKDRLSSRVQLLLTPTSNLTAKFSADFEPKQPQLQNGLTWYHAPQFKFANGSLVDPNGTQATSKLGGFWSHNSAFAATDTSPAALTRVAPRAYFQNRGFGLQNYVAGQQTGQTNFNQNQGQTVSNKGASLQVDWGVKDNILSSNTSVREYTFDAHNDEGTPFDISVDGGGGVFYRQWAQEFKIQNQPGGFLDYKAGAYGMYTSDKVISKAGWGSDAGAWFATNGQYNTLYANAGANRGAGSLLLKNALQDARTSETTAIDTKSGALFGETELHFTDAFSLTAGLRATHEDRHTDDYKYITANGAGSALNPGLVRNVQTGGFASDTVTSFTDPTGAKNKDGSAKTITNTFYGSVTNKGKLAADGKTVVAGDALNNSASQLALANSVASTYFGAANYAALTAAQKRMVATAKTLRANQIGRLNGTTGADYRDNLFTAQFAPSFKFNENLTGYIAYQYGEKSGSVVSINGLPNIVKPESTNSAEIGFKTFWLDKSIIFNIDAYIMDIKNYQQAVQVVDTFQTDVNIKNGIANPTVYTSAQGNVNKVRVQGVEFDSTFNVIPNLALRFGGSYNDAHYVDYKNAPKTDELGFLTNNFIDMSGKALPGASKWNFVIGGEYTKPVYEKFVAHTSVNTTFQSKYNNTDNLSDYGWVAAQAQVDASLGIGTKNKLWDLSLIGKNIFNNTAHEIGWNSYAPNPYPRWFGIQVSGKL